jgi:lipoprotein NlpD
VSYHTVRRGETLTSIARLYGVPSLKLVRDNRIPDPNRIRVGQRLRVMRPAEEPALKKVVRPETRVAKATGPVQATGRFAWPLKGTVIRRYSQSAPGVAIAASRGATVKAADGGRVVLACERMRGYGKVVVLDHGNGYTTVYAHNASLLVGEGETVRQGQAIARAGSTGRATRSQLEFRLYRRGVPQDPARYLR